MPQFLIGYWCGFVSAALILCLLYANRKRQYEDAARDFQKKKRKSTSVQDETELTGIRVLLVDDSKLSRTVIKQFLEKRKWKISEAEDGLECLQAVKKHSFDLIFLDQNMPRLSGDDTLQRLRIEGGNEWNVPVIAVGSSIRKENEEAFRKKGYVACLGKPIQENRLDEILESVFPDEALLQAPDGFSYEKGLRNFGGNETVYRETLVLFAELWEERREQLRLFLEEENMEEYAILIHAVKGDARTLGTEAFGESAYEQELKAKQGDVRAIRNSFERVIREGDKNAEYFKEMFS